ncbi:MULTISPECIES: hypothetical protein [Bacillus]|uniref:hypothetical protein n=1 Tax=Bacillus TaxID=1386 RepID=UPI0002EE6653|nr:MULTISPECIES: hypothetical protein [Bacillus]
MVANKGEFPGYNKFAEQIEHLPANLLAAKKKFEPIAAQIAEDTPVFLVKGEGKRRVIDDRVEVFVQKYSKKFTVIDPLDYELKGIDDEFRWILAPTITSTLLVDRLARHFENCTKHDLDIRRYYRQFEY